MVTITDQAGKTVTFQKVKFVHCCTCRRIISKNQNRYRYERNICVPDHDAKTKIKQHDTETKINQIQGPVVLGKESEMPDKSNKESFEKMTPVQMDHDKSAINDYGRNSMNSTIEYQHFSETGNVAYIPKPPESKSSWSSGYTTEYESPRSANVKAQNGTETI